MDPYAHDAEALLRDIETESLEQLLNAVRPQSVGNTQIPAFDAHITSVLPGQPIPLSALNRGDVIEIQGASSSGKTHLLYYLIGTCVLSSTLGGWNKAAIVFDVDGTFDVHRFRRLLQSRMVQANTALLDAGQGSVDIPRLTSQALRSLRIFRPTSSLQLAASLANLPAYHAANLPSSEIALLAIDSMSAFYWPDRLAAEEKRCLLSIPATVPGVLTRSAHSSLHLVLTELQSLRKSHGPVVVMMNWGLNPTSEEVGADGIPFYKQHLHPFPTLIPPNMPAPSSYTDYPSLTHHITLNPAPILPLPPGALLSDAREQDETASALRPQHGVVMGRVRTSRRVETGSFSIQVTSDEVIVKHGLSQFALAE